MFFQATAEIFLFVMINIVLLAHLFVKQKDESFTYLLSQLTLVGAFYLTAKSFFDATSVAFYGHYIQDQLGCVLKLAVYLLTSMAFFYTRSARFERSVSEGSYYLLGLCTVLGSMVMISAHSLLMIYLGLELLALSLYAMVALRRDEMRAIEAALKYFIMGSVASALFLYGLSFLYGVTGSLQINEIAQQVTSANSHSLLLNMGLVLVVTGLAFKLAAAPFHMWAPDVYEGSPNVVVTLLSSAPKLAAFAMLIRILTQALPQLSVQWVSLITIVSVLSIALGNMVAIKQTNIKRMFAYSAVAHAGYALLGIIAANAQGYGASLFYMLIYTLMSLAAFAILLLLSDRHYEVKHIEDLNGLYQRQPWIAFLMLILMFSMAGIPPTAGFFAKFGVIQSLVQTGHVYLAVFAVIFAVVGAFYYLRILTVIYFQNSGNEKAVVSPVVNLHWSQRYLVSLNTIALLLLGIFPSFLMVLCQTVFK